MRSLKDIRRKKWNVLNSIKDEAYRIKCKQTHDNRMEKRVSTWPVFSMTYRDAVVVVINDYSVLKATTSNSELGELLCIECRGVKSKDFYKTVQQVDAVMCILDPDGYALI